MVSRLQLPPEIQLAQRLAGNEQVTRDRAVRKLRKYIVARTQRAAGGFTHDELLKVWKGLFYCMWMQDKPLLQEELGRTISQLVHAFQTTEAQHLFLQAFWQTMNREWTGIDRLRLDKFYMLMRMVLNESLKVLKMRGWEERQIEELLELLTSEILHPSSQAPHGVKSHFIEIFLEELTKVGAEELTADQNLKFIDPFCRIAARTKDSLVLNNITRGIFETIVEQAPLAIEDLLNELDARDEEAASDSEESSEGGERGDTLSQKRSEKPPADGGHGTPGSSLGPVLGRASVVSCWVAPTTFCLVPLSLPLPTVHPQHRSQSDLCGHQACVSFPLKPPSLWCAPCPLQTPGLLSLTQHTSGSVGPLDSLLPWCRVSLSLPPSAPTTLWGWTLSASWPLPAPQAVLHIASLCGTGCEPLAPHVPRSWPVSPEDSKLCPY